MKTVQLLYVLLAACFINVTAFGAGRVLPDTAKIVPLETMILVNIQDVNSLQKQFQKTNLYKFYKDPVMAPFFSAFKAKWQKNLRESQDDMVKIITDVNAMPSGRLAVAFILNEQSKTTGEPVFLLISQWGKDVKNIKTAVDKAVKKAIGGGARQEKETVRGREIITITQSGASTAKKSETQMKSEDTDGESNGIEDEKKAAASADTISYCFSDDVLMAAEDEETLKFVISRIEGGAGQSLADNANYQAAMAAVGPGRDIDAYVNVELIIKNIVAQDSSGQIGAQIANFGLDNVTCLGAAMSVGRVGGTPAVIKGLLKINGAKKGIMKIIEPQSSALQMPRFVDAASVSVNVSNISIKNAYDELVKMMTTISPGFKASIETPIVPGDADGKGSVRLKQDIIDYIGPQIIMASSIKKPFTGSDPARTITAVAITDRAAIEKSLATLHASLSQGKPDSKRELLGHTIYITEMAGLPFMMPGKTPMADISQQKPQVQQEMPKLAFTVTDTHLILGTEENVAQAIRLLSNKDAGSLTTAAWFMRAKSALPGSVGIAGLSDGRTYGEYIWWGLKENAKNKSAANAFDPTQMAISGLGEFCDFGLLPNFEAVKKYFGVSTQYVVSRPDGYYFEMQQLDLNAE